MPCPSCYCFINISLRKRASAAARLLALEGSNPSGDVNFSAGDCVLSGRGLLGSDHSSKLVLLRVVCLSVIVKP